MESFPEPLHEPGGGGGACLGKLRARARTAPGAGSNYRGYIDRKVNKRPTTNSDAIHIEWGLDGGSRGAQSINTFRVCSVLVELIQLGLKF